TLKKRKLKQDNSVLNHDFEENGLFLFFVEKQEKTAALDEGGWPSATVAIRMIKFFRRFQEK
ncbi:MAG: hypothetical protein ACTIKA_09815, partial [Psychroflexus halocasei]